MSKQKMLLINKETTKERLWLIGKYPRAYQIFMIMESQMNNTNTVSINYKSLQEILKVSRQTVSRNIKILKEYNFIDVYKNGTFNIYVINRRLSCNSKRGL